jgi:hypothetical protein
VGALAHQLVGLLGGGVERDGMVDPVFDPERQRLVAPYTDEELA